jgi:hypothetical protein
MVSARRSGVRRSSKLGTIKTAGRPRTKGKLSIVPNGDPSRIPYVAGTLPNRLVTENPPTCREWAMCAWGWSERNGGFWLKFINAGCHIHNREELINVPR